MFYRNSYIYFENDTLGYRVQGQIAQSPPNPQKSTENLYSGVSHNSLGLSPSFYVTYQYFIYQLVSLFLPSRRQSS